MFDADTPEIDLRATDPAPFAKAPLSALEPPVSSFSAAGLAGGVAAVGWVGGAIAAPLSYLGLQGAADLHPAFQAGFAALALGPAAMIWLGACAAGEAVRTRRLAARLEARAAIPAAALPPVAADDEAALRLSAAIRDEMEALNAAIDAAGRKLSDLEGHAARNIEALEMILATDADAPVQQALERQRETFAALTGEMRTDTETLARNVSRQIRLIQEASRLFKVEVASAEDVLAAQAAAFNTAADTLADRTAAIHAAADGAGAANARMEETIAGALDALGQATSLTDAARQSTEAAAIAANATAQAVREATQRAVADAKRAAQAVREESQSLEEVAAGTLARLREAADAARLAAQDSQAAADQHASRIEKRLAGLAATAQAATAQAATRAKPAEAKAAPRVALRSIDQDEEDLLLEEAAPTLAAAAARAPARGYASPGLSKTGRRPSPPQNGTARFAAQLSGKGGWGNLFSDSADTLALEAANEADLRDPFQFDAPEDPDAALVAQVVQLCTDAQVDVFEALSQQDMERIATRARFGATARRRAVAELASQSVQRLQRHLRRSGGARAVAEDFRARPDLAKVARRGEHPERVTAYLLIDAALG